jgi:hypothetical protein
MTTTAAPEVEPLVGPAGNGLIAYSYDGDIFIGNPGTTMSIASRPESDVNAIFSPDGTRIAFVRGDPYGDASLVVVRPSESSYRLSQSRTREDWRAGRAGLGTKAARLDS